jgi:hypothetical protein
MSTSLRRWPPSRRRRRLRIPAGKPRRLRGQPGGHCPVGAQRTNSLAGPAVPDFAPDHTPGWPRDPPGDAESSVAMRACREELWSVSSATGWPGWLPRWRRPSHRVREGARRRDRALPPVRTLRRQRAGQPPRGARLGRVANRENARRMLGELDAARAPPSSGVPGPDRPGPDPAFRKQLVAILPRRAGPATRRAPGLLATECPPQGPRLYGLGDPDGEACYRAAIRRGTTGTCPPASSTSSTAPSRGAARRDDCRGEKAFGRGTWPRSGRR